MTDAHSWIGAGVLGAAGEPLGLIDAVYTDNATGRPAWVSVTDPDRTGRDRVAVPVEGSRFDSGVLHVPFHAVQVRTAPHHDPATLISYADGDDLARHYDLIPGQGAGAENRDGDRSMLVSAERAVTSAVNVVVGRARLETSVVTEEQTFTIPVRRQEVRLVVDPLPPAEPASTGSAPAEETYEVVRYAEQVQVTTALVAVERVRMVRRVVTTGQTVTTVLRSEQAEVTHHHGTPTGDTTATTTAGTRTAPDREHPSHEGAQSWD